MSRMRILSAVIVGALLSMSTSCSEGKPPQSQSWSSATGAEAYERLFWKAVKDGDYAQVERHLAPIYTLTTSGGISGRDQALEFFRDRKISDISIGELEVKPEGPDMVVSYVATLESKAAQAPQRYYMTTVWQEAKRGWIAIAHSEIPAGPN